MDNRLYISFSATKKFPECNYNLKMIVREAILATLNYEDLIFETEVSVTFCDNEYIKKLNAEFRNKDSATDVLSFPMYDFESEDDLPLLSARQNRRRSLATALKGKSHSL